MLTMVTYLGFGDDAATFKLLITIVNVAHDVQTSMVKDLMSFM